MHIFRDVRRNIVFLSAQTVFRTYVEFVGWSVLDLTVAAVVSADSSYCILHDNIFRCYCNHIYLLSISEPANPVIKNNSDGSIYPKINPKIVPSSQRSELVEQTSFNYKCPYCSIAG